MLSDFTWNMTGYIPKHQVNPHGDGIIPYVAERIFQLEPEPPKVGSLNEYILSALQEKNLIHFSFFLHHYEPQLNKRIKDFLGVDGGDLYDTDRFIDIKLSCREQMLQKLMDYDLTKGAEYATYIYPFIRDAIHHARTDRGDRSKHKGQSFRHGICCAKTRISVDDGGCSAAGLCKVRKRRAVGQPYEPHGAPGQYGDGRYQNRGSG